MILERPRGGKDDGIDDDRSNLDHYELTSYETMQLFP